MITTLAIVLVCWNVAAILAQWWAAGKGKSIQANIRGAVFQTLTSVATIYLLLSAYL